MPNSIYSRVFCIACKFIKSVQILVQSVHPIVAAEDSIRIKHRNDEKNKELSQQIGP